MELSDKKKLLDRYVSNHYDRLLSTASKIMRDQTAAEDAVQDALLRAARALDRFNPRHNGDDQPAQEALAVWLRRIVINCCNTALARALRQRERVLSYDALPDMFGHRGQEPEYDASTAYAEVTHATEPADDHLSVEECVFAKIDREDQAALVRRVLSEMPESDAALLRAVYMGDRNMKEVAEEIGCQPAMLRRRVAKARQLFAELAHG